MWGTLRLRLDVVSFSIIFHILPPEWLLKSYKTPVPFLIAGSGFLFFFYMSTSTNHFEQAWFRTRTAAVVLITPLTPVQSTAVTFLPLVHLIYWECEDVAKCHDWSMHVGVCVHLHEWPQSLPPHSTSGSADFVSPSCVGEAPDIWCGRRSPPLFLWTQISGPRSRGQARLTWPYSRDRRLPNPLVKFSSVTWPESRDPHGGSQ